MSYRWSCNQLSKFSHHSISASTSRIITITHTHRSLSSWGFKLKKPTSSEVLTCHLEGNNGPPWTSYFVKYSSVTDDHWGKSHFNWTIRTGQNYHILRTGCYPYIKYHCTQRPYEDLTLDDYFFRFIKVVNLGIPCLAYGISFVFWTKKYPETVITSQGPVTIYFHYKENRGSVH